MWTWWHLRENLQHRLFGTRCLRNHRIEVHWAQWWIGVGTTVKSHRGCGNKYLWAEMGYTAQTRWVGWCNTRKLSRLQRRRRKIQSIVTSGVSRLPHPTWLTERHVKRMHIKRTKRKIKFRKKYFENTEMWFQKKFCGEIWSLCSCRR